MTIASGPYEREQYEKNRLCQCRCGRQGPQVRAAGPGRPGIGRRLGFRRFARRSAHSELRTLQSARVRSAARRRDHSRFRPRTARAADRHHRLHEALPGAHHLRRIGVGDAGHADAGSRDPSGTSFAAAAGAGQLRTDRLPLRPARNSCRRAGSPADRRRRNRDLPRLGVPRNLPLRRRAAEPHLGGRRLHRSPELPGLHSTKPPWSKRASTSSATTPPTTNG